MKSEVHKTSTNISVELINLINGYLSSTENKSILKQFVLKNSFHRFKEDTSYKGKLIANKIAEEFLVLGDIKAALSLIENNLDYELDETIILIEMNKSHAISSIQNKIIHTLETQLPGIDRELCAEATKAATYASIERLALAIDKSSPIDVIKNHVVTVAYIPNQDPSVGADFPMTKFWSNKSNSTTIKPDNVFLDMLNLANISTSEWLSAVEIVNDINLLNDLDEDSHAWEHERQKIWQNTHNEIDPNQNKLIEPIELVHAIDNSHYGFTPLIAFNINIKELLENEWGTPVSLSGGILGLHNFENGSGDPIRFDIEKILVMNRHNMVVSMNQNNDIATVHGFVEQSFNADVNLTYEFSSGVNYV